MRATWAELGGTVFLARLRGLADQLLQREPEALPVPAEDADEGDASDEDDEEGGETPPTVGDLVAEALEELRAARPS